MSSSSSSSSTSCQARIDSLQDSSVVFSTCPFFFKLPHGRPNAVRMDSVSQTNSETSVHERHTRQWHSSRRWCRHTAPHAWWKTWPNSPKTRPQLKERSCKRARRTACKDRAPPAHPRQASAVTEDCRLTAVFCVRQITQKAPASAYHRPPTWQAKNTTNQGRPLHPRSWGTSECPKTCCPLIEVDGSRSCAVQHMKDWR